VKTKQQGMDGSEVITRELVQAGVQMLTACRGGPGSEVLLQIFSFKRSGQEKVYTVWSIHEECAFEMATVPHRWARKQTVL
jgi:TPP-dependent indolepyruvate ferredoxin oxidoreductase alpha subunit